jgi:hypothetical protein
MDMPAQRRREQLSFAGEDKPLLIMTRRKRARDLRRPQVPDKPCTSTPPSTTARLASFQGWIKEAYVVCPEMYV